jgi:coenzyme F420-reducing hydrogenase delta subunit
MAKRFTDTEKWKDEWFTDLTNDYKVIWQYLLDTCDNAGIFKKNIKILNIMCNTNVSAEDILNTFKGRISILSDDKWFINKFCVFQYGSEFLNSKNKAVTSAVQKLIDNGIIDKTMDTLSIVYPYSIDTPSIPYQYFIDSPKEEDKDKVIDKINIKEIVKEELIEKAYIANIASPNVGVVSKILNNLIQLDDSKKHFQAVEDLEEVGGLDYVADILRWDESVKNNWTQKIFSSNQIHSGIFPQ